MGNSKKLKRIAYISTGILIIGIIFFVSHGPYISNTLKKIILPELENMTGRKVIAQKIYLNLFPLFVEAKGVKVFDDEGRRVLFANRLKGYMGLSGIFRRELVLKRVVIKEPEIWTDKEQLDDIIGKVRDYLAKKSKKKIKVRVEAIEVRDGGFSFSDAQNNTIVAGRKFNGEVLLGEVTRLMVDTKELILNARDFPEFRCGIKSMLIFKKDGIDVRDITLKAYGSEMHAQGSYLPGRNDSQPSGKGVFKTGLNVLADSVKKIFGLKNRGEGKISAEGDVKFEQGIPSVNFKLKGGFYIQTLMEFLKVKEKIQGWVDVDGKISGTLSKITGSGDVRLRNGNLFNVDVDELRCKVSYANGVLNFRNGKAFLYNGRANAEATLRIPKVDFYSVKIDALDVDSAGVFKLIGWQPGFPEGKVKGEMYTSGSTFNPSGWFDYDSRKTGSDALGRVTKIKGKYEMYDEVLSLHDTEVRTGRSTLNISGTIDIPGSSLDLKGKLETIDFTDLTLPYFSRLKGQGNFDGTITGRFDNPLIEGALRITSASFDDYGIENISGEISYRKNLLSVKELTGASNGEKNSIKGSIRFDEAKNIFELKKPYFNLNASLRGADFEKLVRIFYKKLPLRGKINSDFRITGNGPEPEYSGSATINEAEAYGIPADSLSADFSYNYRELNIRKAYVKRGASAITAEGRITRKDEFSFNITGERIFLKDTGLKGMPEDVALNIRASGSGTFENPAVNINGTISGGAFKGKPLGKGTITASIKNKDILFSAALFDEKMKIKGRAYLNDALPWSAEIDISSGRYDFILSSVLKEAPEDLLLYLKGHAELSGDRKNFRASAVINQVNLSLFGYGFSNDSDIMLKFDNRKMSFPAFTLRSGNASFRIGGDIEIGKEFNVALEGSSALSPLKGFSTRISVLRGEADFSMGIVGKWDAPQISGNLNVRNASFGLKDIPQRIGSISGFIFFEGDRIVIQKLSGKLGGGDIDVSGLVYLKGFGVKRFYVEAGLSNISTSVSKDFTVNFSGDVIYKGTPESRNITGEVNIKRAKYRERVEWKSWLLKARAKERPKAELTGVDKAALNVRVYGSENITVDNNIARASVKVDLALRGTVGHPLIFGRIESKGGKVYFRNNEFQILEANADFADPNRINPVMAIAAQTIVKGYTIKLNLEGQFEHFNLSLASDPPLEETDILSLLTVGQIGKELKGLEGGIGAGEAAAFLTGKVQDVFEERLRSLTGFDRVQVDPYVSKVTGTVGPRVTVSKKLLGDKLFVTYTSSVGATAEQVLKLEYIMGKHISLVGVRDELGSVGGDIKFRFEFK